MIYPIPDVTRVWQRGSYLFGAVPGEPDARIIARVIGPMRRQHQQRQPGALVRPLLRLVKK